MPLSRNETSQIKGHLTKFSVQMKHKWRGNRGILSFSYSTLNKKISLNIPGYFFKSHYNCHPSVCFKTIYIFRLTPVRVFCHLSKTVLPLQLALVYSSLIYTDCFLFFKNLGLDRHIPMLPLLSPSTNG